MIVQSFKDFCKFRKLYKILDMKNFVYEICFDRKDFQENQTIETILLINEEIEKDFKKGSWDNVEKELNKAIKLIVDNKNEKEITPENLKDYLYKKHEYYGQTYKKIKRAQAWKQTNITDGKTNQNLEKNKDLQEIIEIIEKYAPDKLFESYSNFTTCGFIVNVPLLKMFKLYTPMISTIALSVSVLSFFVSIVTFIISLFL